MLDRPPPDGYANWTAPLPAHELGAASSLSGSDANCLSGTRSRLRNFGTARFTGLPALRPRRGGHRTIAQPQPAEVESPLADPQ